MPCDIGHGLGSVGYHGASDVPSGNTAIFFPSGTSIVGGLLLYGPSPTGSIDGADPGRYVWCSGVLGGIQCLEGGGVFVRLLKLWQGAGAAFASGMRNSGALA